MLRAEKRLEKTKAKLDEEERAHAETKKRLEKLLAQRRSPGAQPDEERRRRRGRRGGGGRGRPSAAPREAGLDAPERLTPGVRVERW